MMQYVGLYVDDALGGMEGTLKSLNNADSNFGNNQLYC